MKANENPERVCFGQKKAKPTTSFKAYKKDTWKVFFFIFNKAYFATGVALFNQKTQFDL